MPLYSTELSSPARYAALPDLMLGLAGLAARMEIPESEIARLQLVLEELFSNSIDHGYRGESDDLIGVGLRSTGETITLHYRDWAPAFNPARRAQRRPIENQVGGLGINLILGMASAVRYQRLGDSNLLEIDF